MCVLAMIPTFQVHAQTQHSLSLGREATTTGAGLVTHGVSLLLSSRNSQRPDPVIDIANVPAMDRVATHQWRMKAHRSSNVLLGLGFAVSVVGPTLNQQGHEPLLPLAIISESILVTSGLTNVAKQWVRRPRPYLYSSDGSIAMRRGREDFVSFWSGHTANTAAFTFSAACMIDRSSASNEVKTATWIGAAAVPMLMGYLRVRAGRHFPTDVLTGFVVGALVGTVVPYIHRAEAGALE